MDKKPEELAKLPLGDTTFGEVIRKLLREEPPKKKVKRKPRK